MNVVFKSEGRSGAFFFFTPDNKYLIKTLTLTTSEAKLLVDTLPDYVEFMKANGASTYLTKYFGLHSVQLYSKRIFFMVSANIFPSDEGLRAKIRERYDIKGSFVDRRTNRHLFENKLMKDEDIHFRVQIDRMTSDKIHSQLNEDTRFLASHCIMDYSLLLGVSYEQIFVNKEANEEENYAVSANVVEGPGIYYIGVIDMLQKWNTNKKMERLFKTYVRCKNKAGISCVEPQFYRKRFLKKMTEIGM